MGFPFKAIGFDWANTLVSLGEEGDRNPLEKVFIHLEEKEITLPDFEVCLNKSRELFRSMIELSRTTHMEARYEEVLQYLLFILKFHGKARFRFRSFCRFIIEKSIGKERFSPRLKMFFSN